MDRRQILRQFGLLLAYCVGALGAVPKRMHGQSAEPEGGADAIQNGWTIRSVQPGDEAALMEVMRASVADADSFNGQCAPLEWTTDWAKLVIDTHPASLVVAYQGSVVAFLDLPPKKPASASPKVERNQQAFWCNAGGVRSDLLDDAAAVSVFRQLLYRSFARALELGFRYVRCAAPWEQHPRLPTPFADYPGLTISPFKTDDGDVRYLIEWSLSEALTALEMEGAADALPEIARQTGGAAISPS